MQVRGFEIEAGDAGKVEPLRRRRHPLGPGERISDRDPHVGTAELGEHRAVDKLDQRMDHRLWVDHDIKLFRRQSEQVVRLDQLEPLIHQSRRIDRDFGAHRPIGMRDGLGRGGSADGFGRRGAERATARGQDDSCDIVGAASRKTLKNRIVLAVDRQQGRAARGSCIGHQRAGGDQSFLVRERDRAPGLDGRHYGSQPGAADDRRDH